jgi:hypothetical protein
MSDRDANHTLSELQEARAELDRRRDRLLVTRHREVPHPVVMYSHREWRPFEQRYCWTLSRPWGGVLRHPTELFVYMVSELFEETKSE